jgi:hypothetical protein
MFYMQKRHLVQNLRFSLARYANLFRKPSQLKNAINFVQYSSCSAWNDIFKNFLLWKYRTSKVQKGYRGKRNINLVCLFFSLSVSFNPPNPKITRLEQQVAHLLKQ